MEVESFPFFGFKILLLLGSAVGSGFKRYLWYVCLFLELIWLRGFSPRYLTLKTSLYRIPRLNIPHLIHAIPPPY